MALTVQNLRAVTAGAEPPALLPGQLCFNVADRVMFVGDGSDVKTRFDGTSSIGVPGEGWYSMPMDFSQFSTNFIVNPEVYGDIPTDGQVLTWDSTLGHTTWTNGGSTSNVVYATSNSAVAAAPGATLTIKINNALGVVSPDPNDWVVVVGLPGDVFQGLYYFDTEWIKAANYAFPTAAQVPYSNTVSGLTANDVQEAVDELETLTAAAQGTADAAFAAAGIAQDAADTAQADATQALADAAAAQSTADAALPKAGGTMTGLLTGAAITATSLGTGPVTVTSGNGITFTGAGSIFGISGVVNSTSNVTAASSAGLKIAYDLAAAAVPRSSYTAQGALVVGTGVGTFGALSVGTQDQILAVGTGGILEWVNNSRGDVTGVTGVAPIVVDNTDPQTPEISVNLATTAAPGVVQVELTGNINIVNGIINVPDGTTAAKGAVQLYNSTSGGTASLALTAAAGASLQSQIDGLTLANSVTLAGGYDATTGKVDGPTSAGVSVGFLDNQNPPAASATTVDYYLLCTTAGNIPSAMSNGDWLLVSETSPGVYAYVVLGVGSRPGSASYTQAGIVALADGPAVLAGTSDTTAITPQALQDNVIDSVTTTNSSQIASATAVKTANDNAVAAQTTANTANATANAALPKAGGTMTGTITSQDINVQATYGVQFAGGVNGTLDGISDSTSTTDSTVAASATAVKSAYDVAAAAIPCSTLTTCGEMLVAGIGGVPTALPLGTDGQILKVNTFCSEGLEWADDAPGDVTGVNATFPITVDNTDPQQPVIGINGASTVAAGAVQLSDSVSSTSSLEASTPFATKTAYDLAAAAVPCSSFAAKGNLLAGTASGTYSALAVGAAGQFLSVNPATGTGLEWCTLSLACVPCSAYTAVGTILSGTGAGTYCSVTVGSDGQVLVANGSDPAGVTWTSCSALNICGYTCTATPFNTVIGATAGAALTANSVANTAIGFAALDAETSGDFNVAIGHNALTAQNGATGNTVIGGNAGAAVTSGGANTIVGYNAGDALTTGSQNTAIGVNALGANVSGTSNVAVGSSALQSSTGIQNVGVGNGAGCAATTGTGHVYVGYLAGASGTSSTNNTAVGWNAGSLTTGSCNTFVGNSAGSAVTTGSCNTLVGRYTGTATLSNNVVLSDGAANIKLQINENGAVGVGTTPSYGTAGQVLASQGSAATPIWCTLSLACIPCSAFTTTGQILVGTGASTFTALPVGTNGQVLVPNSSCATGLEWITVGALCLQGYTCTATPFNTAIGANAGDSITSGTDNVTLGYNAGTAITTGSQNVVIGSGAAVSSNSVGVVTIGFCSGQALTTAGCVTHIGYVSGRNSTGLNNTYVGALTGCAASNTSTCGTLLGFCAGSALTTGNGNNFIGFQAGRNVNTGSFNVAIGTASFQTATTAANNVAVGCGALSSLSTSSGNTALGHRAMVNASTAANNVAVGCNAGEQLSTGSNNVLIGVCAGDTITTGTQNTFLGAGSGGAVATTSEGNTGVGFSSLGQGVTSGAYNTAVGTNAGLAVTSGALNTLVGYTAGQSITTGGSNTLVGRYVGTPTLANNVVLSDGAGTIRFQSNASGAISLGAGGAYGTAGQILVSGGSGAAPTWTTSAALPANYGSFLSTTSQTNLDTTNGNAATFDTTTENRNVSVQSNSRLTVTTAGTYNIQFSAQMTKTDGGSDDINIWFKKNGVNVANSASNITLVGNNTPQLATVNFILTLAANDYVEIWWYSADANVVLLAEPAAAPYPAIPSIIATVVPVGA